MKYRWKPESIEWFINASKFTKFHEKLAAILVPNFTSEDYVCDFGCGLGLIDIELSKYVKSITSIDIEQQVIDSLSDRIKGLSINNIFPEAKDVSYIQSKFDIGIMSFFGKSGNEMIFYKNMCTKKLIRIVNNKNESLLYPQKYRTTKKDTVSEVKKELQSNNLSYEFFEAELEFGQPLKSADDAKNFLLFHAPMATNEDIDTFISNAVYTEDENFPLYVPNKKTLGIFIIDCEGRN